MEQPVSTRCAPSAPAELTTSVLYWHWKEHRLLPANEEIRSPFVDGDQATFYYPDSTAENVKFLADSTDSRPIAMERGTEGWWLTRTYPRDARDEYMFLIDGWSTLDPLNPLQG